ncbi:MAG: aspartate aminotransferase family protein [Pedobacter sp.]|nr:MAG: aspartate aminotransferase family protein [Pedobacter sp.]
MISKDILSQFIAPDGSGRETLFKLFGQVQNSLLDFLTLANDSPPLPIFNRIDSGEFGFPDLPRGDEVISVLERALALGMNPSSSGYLGHMDSIPALWSVLGELVSSAMNNNMLSLEMSPYLTQMEYALMSQFARIFGLPGRGGGMMLSGGTLSNLQALTVARNIKLNVNGGNLFGIKQQPVLFCSEHAHASVFKAGMLLGIGVENVIKVRANEHSRMDVSDLEAKIGSSLASGQLPFAVVATAGTTVTGSIDPLRAVAMVAKRFDLWLHVDAIYGGALMLSPARASCLDGIGLADSIAFNPQKWMYISKTCSMVLFADFDQMQEAIRISAPYMKSQQDFTNLGEISIQGTRHADVLKLYLTMLSIGKQGFCELIEHSFGIKDLILEKIVARDFLKLCTTGEMNIICFCIKGIIDAKQEQLMMTALHEHLQVQGFFLSLPRYKDRLWLRCVPLNPFLETEKIDQLFEQIDRFCRKHINMDIQIMAR